MAFRINAAAIERTSTFNKTLAQSSSQYYSTAFQLIDRTLKLGQIEWRETGELRDHQDFYNNFPTFKKLITQIRIADNFGILRASSLDDNPDPINISDQNFFRKYNAPIIDDLLISRGLIEKSYTNKTIDFSRPLFNKEGKFEGVIVASVPYTFLEEFINKANLDHSINVELISLKSGNKLWSSLNSSLSNINPNLVRIKNFNLESYLSNPTQNNEKASWHFESFQNVPMGIVITTDMRAALKTVHEEQILMGCLGFIFVMSIGLANFYLMKANSASEMKSRFLASLSHELRTPLNGILGFSELIFMSEDVKQSARYGKLINTSATHLHQLVNTMLSLTQIEAGKLDLNITLCDLREMCTFIKNIHEPKANKKNISLILDFPDNISTSINTDRIKLIQILNNVLHNAIKFTATGSVILSVTQFQEQWIFRIIDSGIGMSATQLNTLFERFSPTVIGFDGTNQEQGSGLGMAICKELVDLLEGHIKVQSTNKIGTVVEIFLPYLSSKSNN